MTYYIRPPPLALLPPPHAVGIIVASKVPWRCQGDVVEVASGRQACCGVGGAAAARGMTEATGVPLRCWGGGGVVGA